MSDPNAPTPSTPADPNANPPAAVPAKRSSRKKWLIRLAIALPVLLILFVLLLPTLLSLGFIRAMIVPRVSAAAAPNGRLAIDDWSFGWFSGQRIEGVKLFDEQNAEVARLNIQTGASLLSLIRGNYDVGDTRIDGSVDVKVDAQSGRVNLLHILGSDEAAAGSGSGSSGPKSPPKAEPSTPVDLASVKGKVTLNLVGKISSINDPNKTIPSIDIRKANAVIDLNDLEKNAGIDGALSLDIDGKPANVALKGTADVVENGKLVTDPNKIAADVVAQVDQLDLSVIDAGLAAAQVEGVDVNGLFKGKLVVNVQPGGAASIRAEDGLGIDNLIVTAPQLQGDTFTSKRIDLPLSITCAAGSDEIKIESAGIKSDLASVSIAGSVSQKAITNLQNNQAPGVPGSIQVRVDVPKLADVAARLPHVTHLQQGVTVTGGSLSNVIRVDLLADGAKVTQSLALDAQGTRDGKPISIQKTTVDGGVDLALNGKPLGISAIKSLALKVAAPFATIDANGVPEKLTVGGNIDLTRFLGDVSQFVDLGKLKLDGVATFNLASAGLPTDTTSPLALRGNLELKNLVIANNDVTYLNNETVNGNVDLLYKATPSEKTVTFRKLAVRSESGLFDVSMQGDSAWFTLFSSGGFGGEANLGAGAALDRLLAPFTASMDETYKLRRGRLGTTISLSYDKAKGEYVLITDGGITRLAVGNLIKEETLKFGTSTYVSDDLSGLKTWYEVASNFVNAKGEAVVSLPKNGGTALQMIRSASVAGSVPDLPKLYALLVALAPPEPVLDADGKPLPPMQVTSGNVEFKGALARDSSGNVLQATFDVPGVNDLALQRGPERYRQAQPITLSFAADVSTDASKATVAEQLKQIVVKKLSANMPGVVALSMPIPITLKNLDQPTPLATGEIAAKGQTESLGEFLGVFSGSNPLPVKSTFTLDQTLSTNGGAVYAVGFMKLTGIEPIGPDAQPLPEALRTVTIENDLAYNATKRSASINKLELLAPQAKDVLSVRVVGNVNDIGMNNQLEGVKATLDYDLARAWPVLRPFVDPTGESLGKIDPISGKYSKTFAVAGSYPSVDRNGKPLLFNNAIRSVEVTGDLVIDRANLVEKGIDVADLVIPITLRGGVLRTTFADGSSPKPFKVNEGEGNLGGLTIDLTAGEPLLGNLKDYRLVTNAKLNPVVANSLGKLANPIFPNATKAGGYVSVSVSTKKLFLGESLTTSRGGSATVALNLTNMEISNPLGEQLLGGFLNKGAGVFNMGGIDTKDISNFRGEVRDAIFSLNKGVVTQNATFMIGNVDGVDTQGKPKLYPFTFAGDVRLSDLAMNLDAGFPLQLVKNKLRGDDLVKFFSYLPDEVKVNLGGTTTTPKIDFAGDLTRIFSEAGLKFGADRLLGGDKKSGDGKKSDAEKVGDIIGGIFGEKKADQQQPADSNNGSTNDRRDDRRRSDREDAKPSEPTRDETPREQPKDDSKQDPPKKKKKKE